MKLKFKKIDVIIVCILILTAGLFLHRAGYINIPILPPDEQPLPPPPDNETPPPDEPLPPTSFIPSYRRAVSPEDEGVHFDKIRISREWWYYSAVFDENSELPGWTVTVSFNHMALGDLLGTLKPDLLVVGLYGPDGELYGGMINKKRGLGILSTGTLMASSPGVNVEFDKSWAEGEYPEWHVHAEDEDIDKTHEVVIDLDYIANSLPIWTIGNRAFDKSKSTVANYLFTGCTVTGTVTIDDTEYTVKGTGHHEHSWTPLSVTRGDINGWDWFYMELNNSWSIYLSNYHPTPQAVTTETPRVNPFGTILISTDNGLSYTELRNVDLKITREDSKIFPFVKMPAEFNIVAKPSINPIYAISQSLLYGTNINLDFDVEIEDPYNKVWKFPTYVGMKTGRISLSGTLSWSDEDGDYEIPFEGIGVAWSMRALL
jgi:hypothetical protein